MSGTRIDARELWVALGFRPHEFEPWLAKCDQDLQGVWDDLLAEVDRRVKIAKLRSDCDHCGKPVEWAEYAPNLSRPIRYRLAVMHIGCAMDIAHDERHDEAIYNADPGHGGPQ